MLKKSSVAYFRLGTEIKRWIRERVYGHYIIMDAATITFEYE